MARNVAWAILILSIISAPTIPIPTPLAFI